MKSLQRIFCLTLLLSILFSAPVSEDRAIKAAMVNFPDKTLLRCEKIADDLYLATFKDDGFILISGDDGFPAILGYSDSTPTGVEHPAFKDMYTQYSREIKKYKNTNRAVHSDWKTGDPGKLSKAAPIAAVQPLIASRWNQSPHYNNQFPYFTLAGHTTQRPYVGCVAVVMGQLMNYYEHPQRGFGKRTYYSSSTSSFLEAWHDTTWYDYGNMPDTLCDRYGTQTVPSDQVYDVSLFLYQCAVSVEMDLQPDGSSAAYEDMMYALTSYFDYNTDMVQIVKSTDTKTYTDTEWKQMIISELNAGRPLPYRGSGDGGGHAFLLDGYETTTSTYFHINWGWGSYYDGWFLLTALNPADGYDYTENQAAVFNIQPNPDDLTRYAYTGFEGRQAGWIYDGGGFYLENGGYDMVRTGDYSYGFDGNDQWLISPGIFVPDNNNAVLSIWAKMLNSSKRCTVYVSQTDTARTSFTTALGTISPTNTSWNEYLYSLRTYKNSTIYLGINYDLSSGYITLDDISIYTPKVLIAISDDIPETHELLRIYPNPFNPRTQVQFYVPSAGSVDIKVFDLNGRLITTLANGMYDKGMYRADWDARDVSSGIYIASLNLDNKQQITRKMVLVK